MQNPCSLDDQGKRVLERVQARVKGSLESPRAPDTAPRPVTPRAGLILTMATSLFCLGAVFWIILPRASSSPGIGIPAIAPPEAGQDRDGEIAKKVERLAAMLGHDDPAVREKAEGDLRKLGPKARESLARFAEFGGGDVKARVERLLGCAALLPVEEPVRSMVSSLEMSDLGKAKQGVVDLLKADRRKINEALKICAALGTEVLRFRSKALLDILSTDPVQGVRYGLLLSQPKYKPEEQLSGLELWMNDSKEERTLKDVRGTSTIRAVGESEGFAGVDPGKAKEAVKKMKPFALAPGAARVLERTDLDNRPVSVSGRHRISTLYSSDEKDVEAGGKKVSVGVWKSNALEFWNTEE